MAVPMIAAASRNASSAAGSPAWARRTASSMSIARPCAAETAASIAPVEATASTQPRRPHVQTRAGSARGRWPISPDTPYAPVTTCAVQVQAAADATTDRDDGERRRAESDPEPVLAHGEGVDVVLERHGPAEPLLQHCAEVLVASTP